MTMAAHEASANDPNRSAEGWGKESGEEKWRKKQITTERQRAERGACGSMREKREERESE